MFNLNGEHVLVTGATGSIGPTLVESLYETGCKIRTLSLDKPEEGMFPGNIDIRTGDITDERVVEQSMEGIDLVFHLAALLHLNNPTPELTKEYTRINSLGTNTLIEEAIKAHVKKFILFSTISVYGDTNGKIIDETTPPRPETAYAKTKLTAERSVLEAKGDRGQPIGVVLRLGAVYGPRIKGNYKRLAETLASRRFMPIGKGQNRRTLVYVKDAADAAKLAASHPRALGKIYNVSDGTFHSVKEIIEAICSALGQAPPKLFLPYWPTKISVAIAEGITGFLGIRSLGLKNVLTKYCEDVAVDSRRIHNELGFQPAYDLNRGWQETIEKSRIG